jgi:hypothetical protein
MSFMKFLVIHSITNFYLLEDIEHIVFLYTIISYHLPKKRYNIIYIIS